MTNHKENIEKLLELTGNRLRTLRKEAGYSAAEKFAYKNDISRAQYSRYENGSDMHLSTLFKLLEKLDISPVDFFKKGFDQ